MKNACCTLSFLLFAICTVGPIFGQDSIDYNRDIRPLLADRCYACHGPDESANESGMRLDIESEAIDAGVWVPGKPSESELVERITADDDSIIMPPRDSNLTLSTKEIDRLEKWVKEGAKVDQHWAFKTLPKHVDVPKMSAAEDAEGIANPWARNSIDLFVLSRLKQNELKPSPEAERWRWLRRVTFDLTGIPPTPAEISEFEKDQSLDAYERVVERLLASKHFGQHMATPWLDLARYADSYGYQSDQLSPTWPYRDWVVRSLNDNLPYDQFLTWQLAGDLLPDATTDQKLATAFNRLHRQTNEGGSVQLEWQTEYVADRVHTFGTAMLGLTLECCRCHDHRFDPIPQKDYYNLSAFFNNVDEWGTYHDSSRVPTPSLLLPNDQQAQRIKTLEIQLTEVREQIAARRIELKRDSFQPWQKSKNGSTERPIPVDLWSFDNAESASSIPNEIAERSPAKSSNANQIVDRQTGKALKLSGDDAADFPASTQLHPWERYAVSFWLKIPSGFKNGVILHRQGGTDVGSFGTEVSLRNGRILFAKKRFWPGNALAIETVHPVSTDQWIHIVATNRATGTAAGMSLFVDGVNDSKIVRDHLTKSPSPGGSGISVGQRFRAPGFKDGQIDELAFYDRPLTQLHARAIADQSEKVQFDKPDVGNTFELFLAENAGFQKLMKRQAELVKQVLETRLPVMETMVMEEMPNIRAAHVLARGAYDSPRTKDNVAVRATPSALPPMKSGLPKNRLGLAQWLVDSDHPLTSRVAVNRFWQNFFGTGLVASPGDFGLQGANPSHPQLLDWLARDFVNNGWDVKQLCKQIVLSSTYRQSSRCDRTLRQRDPDNSLLARGPARRLSAEMIRDMTLLVSGLLKGNSGGPPVSPYQPAKLWRESNSMSPAYNQSVGKSLYNRSLYSIWKRTAPLPNMLSFDATNREVCSVRRTQTNTPLQALVLLNDVQFVEATRVLAERTLLGNGNEQVKDNLNKQIGSAFVRLTGRDATNDELKLLAAIYDDQEKLFIENPTDATRILAHGETKPNDEIKPEQLAAMTIVCQAILNCDATLWKR